MPLYEYRCEACRHQFEIIQKFSDDPIAVCPSCGQGTVVKLLSSPAIQFKGSGWYITDYARKGQSSVSGSTDGGTKSDAAPTSASESGKTDGAAGKPAASQPAAETKSSAKQP
jgi:putative FmdB family regulatory protein